MRRRLTEGAFGGLLAVAILGVGLIVTVALLKSRKPAPKRPVEEYVPVIRAVEVKPQRYTLTVRTNGTVSPSTETALVCQVAGRVVEVSPSFASGGFFQKGELLLRVDPRDYELALAAARSQVAQAKVRLAQEEAQAEIARTEWRELAAGDPPPLASRQLQVQEAEAALLAAEAALGQAELNLARTEIKAPFDCRVRQKMADLGQFLSPGFTVATVYAIDCAEIRLPIPDSELAYLDLPLNLGGNGQAEGPSVLLRADFAGETHTWRGRIVRVEGEIDAVTRMVNAVARVEDPYGRKPGGPSVPLSVGLFVEAEILGKTLSEAVLLPAVAVRSGNRVIVVDAESRLRFRDVEVLRMEGARAVIAGGLTAGELVCVSPLQAVSDGMKVRIAPEEPTAVEEKP